MIQTYSKQIGLLLLIMALQVLVLNHVHICGYATPLICSYFILILPNSTARWAKLLWGFGIGLAQDTFANTPGMMAATLTLVALLQPRLLSLFGGIAGDDDNDEDYSPSIAKLGAFPFLRYAFGGILLQCSVFFLLENFSFFSIGATAINIAGSTLLSFLIIWAIESIRSKTVKH